MSDVQAHMRVQDAIETAILDRGVEPPADLADIVFAAARAALESAPSSLRTELAEAQATIARYQGMLAEAAGTIRRLEWELAEDPPIVEAATALVEHRRGSNHWNGTIENDLINKLIDAVAAVEEGARTDGR